MLVVSFNEPLWIMAQHMCFSSVLASRLSPTRETTLDFVFIIPLILNIVLLYMHVCLKYIVHFDGFWTL